MLGHAPLSGFSVSAQGEKYPFEETLTDSSTLAETTTINFVRPLTDGLTLNDILTSKAAVLMAEAVEMGLSLSSNIRDRKTLSDTLSLAEETRLAFGASVAETGTLSESTILGFGTLLADSLTLSGAVTTKATANALAADILALADALNGSGVHASVAETGTLADVIVDKAVMYQSMLEDGTLADALTTGGRMYLTVDEDATLDGTLADTLRAFSTVGEGISTVVTLPVDGVFTGWVMNTETRAVTQYTNYDFTSFAEAGGAYYGTKSDGLYVLSGSDDAGTDIDWALATGIADIGNGYMSRVPECYMGFRSDGSILLKTITGETTERWYKLRPSRNGIHEGRISLGKGVKSRYWQFQLEGISGADLELDSIEFFPVILTRRV